MNTADSSTHPPQPDVATIELVLDGKKYALSHEKALALALTWLEQKHPRQAAKLLARLAEYPENGPWCHIVRGFCEAAAKHWEDCREALGHALTENDAARQLHDIFVTYHLGFRRQAMLDMIDFVKVHRDLPSLCLLLGDMFVQKQDAKRARDCWSMAVRRDGSGGAVGSTARRRLLHLAATTSKTSMP